MDQNVALSEPGIGHVFVVTWGGEHYKHKHTPCDLLVGTFSDFDTALWGHCVVPCHVDPACVTIAPVAERMCN